MIKASEFKAKCPKLMDEIKESGEALTVTKNGPPAVEARPAAPKRRSLLGPRRGKGKILGGITAPVFEDWEARGRRSCSTRAPFGGSTRTCLPWGAPPRRQRRRRSPQACSR